MNTEILLVEDPTDLNYLLKLEKNVQIYSLNYSTHKILVKNRINHKIGEDLLDVTDHTKINKEFIDTTINWYNLDYIRQKFNFNGINLANLIELELSQYFMPIYKSVYVIKKIIEKEKPSKVISYTYLNDFVERLCNAKNIQTILINQGQPMAHLTLTLMPTVVLLLTL